MNLATPADEALTAELTEHVRGRLGKHAFPREIEFVESLPKTPSGKIQRFILRSQGRAVPALRLEFGV